MSASKISSDDLHSIESCGYVYEDAPVWFRSVSLVSLKINGFCYTGYISGRFWLMRGDYGFDLEHHSHKSYVLRHIRTGIDKIALLEPGHKSP